MATSTPHEAIPPQPKAVLRGHKAPVHAAAFLRANDRLLTGDADGYVVAWDLAVLRPRAVWQAHQNAVLAIAGWGADRAITHGRDNKLVVWRLSAADEAALSTDLPLDPLAPRRNRPCMLHLLEVNAMNFCAFASCPPTPPASTHDPSACPGSDAALLIAVPNTLLSEAMDIYHLPSQNRVHVVKLGGDHGMAMALSLLWLNRTLTLLVGYEDGMAVVAQLGEHGAWCVIYRSQCHKQPVLSLDVAPSHAFFLTSSADASIAKHPLLPQDVQTAGLVEDGPETGVPEAAPANARSASLLSAALASQPSAASSKAASTRQLRTQPLKLVDTKHAGQQCLRFRSDGRIFATAGWDAKIRVYSAKSMREVAVLKWHPLGCFAVAFANINAAGSGQASTTAGGTDEAEAAVKSLVPKVLDVTVKDRRIAKAKSAHWLAAGSKDGKISLWDIY